MTPQRLTPQRLKRQRVVRQPARASRAAQALDAELAQAQHLIVSGHGLLASELLMSLREAAPRHPAVHRLLAIEALQRRSVSGPPAGPPGDALTHAQTHLALVPNDAFALMLLGRAHKQAGDLPAATAAYRRAIARQPRLAEAHVSLGIALKAAGDLHAAVASYRQALAIEPTLSAAHANLGIALARLVDITPGHGAAGNAQALASLRRAVQANDRDIGARHNLGVALLQGGQWLEAAEQFNAALALDAGRLDSCLALHAALSKLHLLPAARECCERWLAANLPHVEVVNRLLSTVLTLDDLDTAQACGEQALALAPDMPEVLHNLGHLGQRLLDVPGALAHLRHAAHVAPAYAPGWQTLLMCLNYVEEDQRTIAAEHRRFGAVHGQRLAAAPGPAWAAAAPGTPARLRVGWLSGDFRRHSVAYFMEALFEAHDRALFDWVVYDTSPAGDDVTARLKAQAAAWVAADDLNDDALAERISGDGIHILVDLAGHTAGGRHGVLARQPAPVQISYLGYPTTTGLPAVAWRLSDDVIDPPGEDIGCSESVLRLPGGMFCYRPDTQLAVGPLPARRNGHITFGSFNNLAKLSPTTLSLWAAALHAVPNSRLLLKARSLSTPTLRARLEAAFAANGIEPGRLQLDAWADGLDGHLALYGKIDIALDSYPYNGATTTCEALWMGVPVLSLAGSTHVSRAGSSILRSARLDDWVVRSKQAFVAAAVARAADLPALAHLRAGLREHLRGTPLLDAPKQVVDLSALFEQAWAIHIADAAPAVGQGTPAAP